MYYFCYERLIKNASLFVSAVQFIRTNLIPGNCSLVPETYRLDKNSVLTDFTAIRAKVPRLDASMSQTYHFNQSPKRIHLRNFTATGSRWA